MYIFFTKRVLLGRSISRRIETWVLNTYGVNKANKINLETIKELINKKNYKGLQNMGHNRK